MQHSVRFNILYSFSLFVPGLLLETVLCTLCGSETGCLNIVWLGDALDCVPSIGDLQSASSGTCKSQWYAAVGVLSLSHGLIFI